MAALLLSAVFWTAVLPACLVGPETPSSVASAAAGELAAPPSSVEGTALSKKLPVPGGGRRGAQFFYGAYRLHVFLGRLFKVPAEKVRRRRGETFRLFHQRAEVLVQVAHDLLPPLRGDVGVRVSEKTDGLGYCLHRGVGRETAGSLLLQHVG